MQTHQNENEVLLNNPERMIVLLKLAMIDSPEEPFFDRLVDIASRIVGTPVSLVSMVTDTYQFFKSSHGLPEPWQSQRQTPLTHSFCQHVVNSGEPLVIEDARENPLVQDNLAIPDLNVIGYLGVPLATEDGHQLGSFCVIDSEPRQWTDDEVQIISMFGEVVNAEIDARAKAYKAGQLDDYIQAETFDLEQLEQDLLTLKTTPAILDRLQRFHDEIAQQ